jgi:hypothetical protein
MDRRLRSRCRGLVEITAPSNRKPSIRKDRQSQNVQFLHITVRDFLRNTQRWKEVQKRENAASKLIPPFHLNTYPDAFAFWNSITNAFRGTRHARYLKISGFSSQWHYMSQRKRNVMSELSQGLSTQNFSVYAVVFSAPVFSSITPTKESDLISTSRPREKILNSGWTTESVH